MAETNATHCRWEDRLQTEQRRCGRKASKVCRDGLEKKGSQEERAEARDHICEGVSELFYTDAYTAAVAVTSSAVSLWITFIPRQARMTSVAEAAVGPGRPHDATMHVPTVQ